MATFNEIHGLLPTLRECRKRSCSPIDVDTQLPPSKRLRFAPDEDSRADMSDRICLDHGSVDARKWFEDSNNDASATDNANFIGGDSPFYLEEGPPTRRASAFAASPISDRGALQGRRSHRPKHADLNRTGSSGSNSEDYRSVIDDLTIENKLLRRKLKKYERLHCSQLESEKLFEVRVHGLPPQKKRDLERALRQIAAGLEDSPEPPSVEKGNGSAPQKTSAPNTASKPGNHYPTPVDSAYASTTSDMLSNPVSRQMERSPEQNVPCADSKQENILAYMQDIPESLAPSRPSELSDKAKSKIIVKRLEQLFDGKSAAYRQSEFSRQQQDVSTSATLVENRAREARGHRAIPEGAREARILPRGSTIPLESTAGRGSHTPDEGSTASSDLNGPRNEDIPDQRPTRPMDLDVHHTQAGFKHMEYIRHLQPTSPVRLSCASNSEEGWVYLNLLSSMAQLHTFNVTPEFVRQAIKDFSSKLQLSSDGHQVKWRGIAVSPAQRTDAESSSAGCDSGSAVDCTDLNNSAGGGVMNYVSTLHKALRSSNTNPTVTNFEYKPLFCHELQSDDDLYLCDSEEGVATEPVADATGVSNSFCAQVPNNTLASAGWTSEGGPIIFYNKACFFTDLSGTQPSSDEANYYRYTQQPLGLCVNPGDMNIDEIDQFTKRPSLKNASSADSFSSREGALNFPDMETLSVQPGEADIAPVAFEASGLGGIQPEDNFVVDVEMRHSPRTRVSHRLSPFSHPRANIRKVHHTIPSRSILAFRESDSGTISKACSTETQGQIISTTTRALPPSALPPASYVCLPFSSSSSDASTSDESEDPTSAQPSDDEFMSDQHPRRKDYDESDEILPHTGHLSTSVSVSPTSRPVLARSRTDDSDESIDMLASTHGRTA